MIVTNKKSPAKQRTLINKLDAVFSEYIRLRDANDKGICFCISCGRPHHWKDIDCGHFVNRGHMSTRYNEKNCNAQCKSCNRFDEGNNIGYTRGIIKKYGIDVLTELEVLKHTTSKWSTFEFEVMINHYKEEVKKLKMEKI